MKSPEKINYLPAEVAPSCHISHRVVARTSFFLIKVLLVAIVASLIYITLTQRS